MTTYFYQYPFASQSGSITTAVPTTGSSIGAMSYQYGFTNNYQLNLLTNPNALPILLGQFNQVMLDATTNLQQYQTYGTPNWITASQNGGVAYPYPIYARVYYNSLVYENQVAGNTATPGVDATWAVISGEGTLTPPQISLITSGSGAYTTPAGAIGLFVRLWGAGGGGGGTNTATSSSGGGGGGGGGAYCEKYIANPTAAQVFNYVVGAAGAGGGSAGAGSNGGASTFVDTLVSHIINMSAGGGFGGSAGGVSPSVAVITNSVVGGTATGGDINLNGGNGGFGASMNDSYNSTYSAYSGYGGNSGFGGGGAPAATSVGNGNAGYGIGGGGSGGVCIQNSGATSGSQGYIGQIEITAYFG
jgi:hypothetical protein